jgi:hypothetical protein
MTENIDLKLVGLILAAVWIAVIIGGLWLWIKFKARESARYRNFYRKNSQM